MVGNARGVLKKYEQTKAVGAQRLIEGKIKQLESEAYRAVLRAFIAQGNSITWEQLDLMNSLQRELNISDVQQKEMFDSIKKQTNVRRTEQQRKRKNDHEHISGGAGVMRKLTKRAKPEPNIQAELNTLEGLQVEVERLGIELDIHRLAEVKSATIRMKRHLEAQLCQIGEDDDDDSEKTADALQAVEAQDEERNVKSESEEESVKSEHEEKEEKAFDS